MKKFLIGCLLFAVMISFTIDVSASTNVGTAGAQFLKIGPGARVDAMGGAFSAVADDVTAIYWNPAGISLLDKTSISDTHTFWIGDTRFNYLAFATPIDRIGGTLGVSVTMLTMPEMEITTLQKQKGSGLWYNAWDSAVSIAYSTQLYAKEDQGAKLHFGVNAKYIHQQIHRESARGVAIDVGTLYFTGWKSLRIGMNFSNFGPDMHFSGPDLDTGAEVAGDEQRADYEPAVGKPERSAQLETKDFALPASFRLGIAYDAVDDGQNKVTIAIDGTHPNDNAERLHFGLEYVYNDLASIRAGYKYRIGSREDAEGNKINLESEEEEKFSAGLGLNHSFASADLILDYAFAYFGRLNSAHRITMGLSF